MARYELHRVSGQPVRDDELLADLRRVATMSGKGTVGLKEYRQAGVYDDSNIARRFGSWNAALVAAGLSVSNEINLSDEQLFENLLTLWSHYGRQPRRRELALPPSTISQSPYNRRFKSWSAALQAFVLYANSSDLEDSPPERPLASGHHTPRDPSLRLRYRVLQRDRFTCQLCGASPAIHPGVVIHVDHIVPWSKGGETVLANLRTTCDRCNLGKGNLEPEIEPPTSPPGPKSTGAA
jgi:Homing endonuclease associated repeat/HNH endonuclease